VQPLVNHLKTGAELYGELGALLVSERGALARHELDAVARANARRQALLEAITEWESATVEWLASAPAGTATLGQAVRALPAPGRADAEAALSALKDTALAARHEAAVNHILVDRNLDTVERTLDILTGRRARLTYGRQGGMPRGGAGDLVARKE
jgi:hypothetical protein